MPLYPKPSPAQNKEPNMKKLILIAIALMLVGGEAASAKTYTEYLPTKCHDFTEIYAGSGFKWNKGSPSWRDTQFGSRLNFILGYLTYAAKHAVAEGHHVNNPTKQVVNPVAWVGSWCRDNPSELVSDALDAYIAK